MKFIYNFYVIIIILRSTRMVENAADFTHDELMQISRKLKPMECMRLLESLYLSIPKDDGHRVTRETPVNAWISNHGCLDELTAWNYEFPDMAQPPGRVVMTLHLNALGRLDLANYVRRNWNALKAPTFHNLVKQKVLASGISKESTDHTLHHAHDGRKRWTRKIQRAKTPRSTNQHINIRFPMTAGAAEGARSNGQATSYMDAPKTWKQKTSKTALIFVIILSSLIIIACGIMLFLLRKPLINCLCTAQWSQFFPGSCCDTREKGICVGYSENMNDAETQSINTCPISEINIEGHSCVNSVSTESRKSFSDTVLCKEACVGGNSIENCKRLVEESVEVQTETWPISCSCHQLKPESCKCEIGSKKKRKNANDKSKEETKSAKSYLKAMQERIRPRQKHRIRKNCTFDMKQFQDKILTLLNQECGICQCCTCNTPGKPDVESRPERHVDRQNKYEKRVKKEEKRSGTTKCESIPTTRQRDDKTVMDHTSMASRSSTTSGRQRESVEEEKNFESSSRRSGSRRAKRAKRVEISTSSSEMEICNVNRKEKRKKYRSKHSKKKVSSDS